MAGGDYSNFSYNGCSTFQNQQINIVGNSYTTDKIIFPQDMTINYPYHPEYIPPEYVDQWPNEWIQSPDCIQNTKYVTTFVKREVPNGILLSFGSTGIDLEELSLTVMWRMLTLRHKDSILALYTLQDNCDLDNIVAKHEHDVIVIFVPTYSNVVRQISIEKK